MEGLGKMKTFLCWRSICSVFGTFAAGSVLFMTAYMELSADLGEASFTEINVQVGQKPPVLPERKAVNYPAMHRGVEFPSGARMAAPIDAALIFSPLPVDEAKPGKEKSAKAELESSAAEVARKAEAEDLVSVLKNAPASLPPAAEQPLMAAKAETPKATPPPPLQKAAMSEVEIQLLIHRIASSHGLDPFLVEAVVRMESMFDPKAVSPRGAMGLMQITQQTAKHLGIEDPWDVRENLEGGMRYLKELLELYPEKIELALAAYNAGPYAVKRHNGIPPYQETRTYVKRVMAEYRRLVQEAALRF